jgi:hypothetical protein
MRLADRADVSPALKKVNAATIVLINMRAFGN